ncbi:endonuclease NucS domain-containing protein [Pseudarthrobacter sp. LMD1-1-1.1]|uniref:endonuclease NucS domain-containing protein n=1 Tax=Pseudarthrobacter sp. LMD1-1-1.1 TaxID=3135242 RepID=UPI003438396F
MADLKLFRIESGKASELTSRSFALERDLQTLIEENMEVTFGVRYLATEYSTGKVHRGRIDSLGLDENGSPVIFEFKRTSNENVINQGLYYLDWLMDHRGEFQILVAARLGPATAESIDWSAPRLICVANDFTRYDEYAVRQIDRNVELVRYRDFGSDLLAIELVTSVSSQTSATSRKMSSGSAFPSPTDGKKSSRSKTVSELLAQADHELAALYEKFEIFALSLGDDVIKNERSLYFAFRRLKNFACVEVHPNTKNLLIYLKVDPESVDLVDGFSRDVSKIGHFGTGDLELRVSSMAHWPLVEELTRQAYLAN